MRLPKVSIILLNMNQPEVTLACIDSLSKTTYPNKEIIVVDQASSDNSVARLGEIEGIRFISSKVNLGFTGGNNLGMRVATGDYFLLLNNDTEVPPAFLEPMVEALEKNSFAGAASPLIRYHQDPGRIQYAGGPKHLELLGGLNSWRGHNSKYPGAYHQVEETSAAHSAAFLIKRSVSEKVGLLDDNFFIYFEELDWSLRMRKRGFSILFVPQSEIFHKDSKTIPKDHPFRVRMMARNRIILNKKHMGSVKLFVSLLYNSLFSFPATIIRYIFSGKRNLMSAYMQGYYEGLFSLKYQLTKY